MVQNIITDLCHHLEIGIDGNLDIGNKRVIVGTPTITLTNNILTISCDTVGANIYYTLDGSTPTSSSTKYTTAVTLNNSCTIKVIAIKGNKSSIVVSQDYIAILTAWRLVGNSVVHTDEYLTQWKVEGNSVVDNNAILSCGDLGQDGKYHVKISNGVDVFDIALTEPLRKVGSVADTIEFANGVAVVTRCLYSFLVGNQSWSRYVSGTSGCYRMATADFNSVSKHAPTYNVLTNVIGAIYPSKTGSDLMALRQGVVIAETGAIFIYDPEYNTDANTFKAARKDVEIIFELATPTTEVIQVSPFPVSPTDTYTSANDTPYSAFEYKKNVEIWSCGEYSAVDGKYHILVQPLGGSIADIALDEPLRKVNDVADSIEFADGVATVTRNFNSIKASELSFSRTNTSTTNIYRYITSLGRSDFIAPATSVKPFIGLCSIYNIIKGSETFSGSKTGIASTSVAVQNTSIYVYDSNYNGSDDLDAFVQHISDMELVYQCTPTTEVIQVPQIEEAESYTCVISQGAKAVEWSSFIPNPN